MTWGLQCSVRNKLNGHVLSDNMLCSMNSPWIRSGLILQFSECSPWNCQVAQEVTSELGILHCFLTFIFGDWNVFRMCTML